MTRALRGSILVSLLFGAFFLPGCSAPAPSDSSVGESSGTDEIVLEDSTEGEMDPEDTSTGDNSPEQEAVPSDTDTPEPLPTATATATEPPTATPTITLTPTITMTPTITSTPTETFTPTPEPGIGDVFECGRYFSVIVLQPPDWYVYIDRENAVGVFLVLRLELVNNTDATWDQMREDNFRVEGMVNDRRTTFALHRDTSWDLYYDFRSTTQYFGDDVPPGMPWQTIVVFDVNPDGEDWHFLFTPSEIWEDPLCEVSIPLD